MNFQSAQMKTIKIDMLKTAEYDDAKIKKSHLFRSPLKLISFSPKIIPNQSVHNNSF